MLYELNRFLNQQNVCGCSFIMSSLVLKGQENFIKLLLETSTAQGLLILKNPTPSQVEVLGEIVNNLLKLEFPKRYKKKISAGKGILSAFSKASGIKKKIAVLRKHSKRILSLLKFIKDCLLFMLA